jgi:subtilase family serine protease
VSFVLAVGSLAAGFTAASPAAATVHVRAAHGLQVVDAAARPPAGSHVATTLSPSTRVSFEVTFAPRHARALSDLVRRVTTPGTSAYRHYLAKGDFARRFGASGATVRAVASELIRLGLHPGAVTANRLALEVEGSAASVERALHTRLASLQLPSGVRVVTNETALLLPHSVAPLVQSVLGLDGTDVVTPADLEMKGDLATTKAGDSSHLITAGAPAPNTACDAAVNEAYDGAGAGLTADQIATAYGLDGLYAAGDLGAGTTVGIIEFSTYVPSDIATYGACYGFAPSVTPVQVDGGPSNADASSVVEAELDIEDVLGLAPAANLLVYEGPNSDGSVTNAGAYDTYVAAINADAAQVITTSWGTCERPGDAADTAEENTIFEQAALQGQTIIAASGDSGSEDCDGTLHGASGSALAVDDPAAQPFVTGVGGTTLTIAPTHSETAWNTGENSFSPGAGGGGISVNWAMPRYQLETPRALGVLTAATAQCGAKSGDCREVPDVSANAGTPYAIFCTVGPLLCGRSGWTALGGTSAAAPTWAAIIALADASTACATTHPLGLINPALYAIGSGPNYTTAFFDVVTGNNDLTGTNGGAYPATAGYDMATGLGTPIAGNGTDSGLVAQLCSPVVEAVVAPASGLPHPTVKQISPSSARSRGGAHVVITGGDFSGASSLTFGSAVVTRSKFTVVSPTKIDVVVPAGAGRVHVTVTTRAGTSTRTRADVFNYLGVPIVSHLTPARGRASGGETVVLTGSGFSGATAVAFGGVRARFTVVSAARIAATAPPGHGRVAVTVRSQSGRSARVASDVFSYRG